MQKPYPVCRANYDAGFTLSVCAHATDRMQEEAAEKMGSFMVQSMETLPTEAEKAPENGSFRVLLELEIRLELTTC